MLADHVSVREKLFMIVGGGVQRVRLATPSQLPLHLAIGLKLEPHEIHLVQEVRTILSDATGKKIAQVEAVLQVADVGPAHQPSDTEYINLAIPLQPVVIEKPGRYDITVFASGRTETNASVAFSVETPS